MPNNIIVTGATSGIGFALTKSLIQKGHTVYAIGRNFEKFLTTISDWCEHRGLLDSIKWISCDFSDLEGISQTQLEDLPKVAGYVNCAGVLPISPLKIQSNNDIKEAMYVNLLAPMLLTKGLLKSNKILKGGSLVYISSINGTKVGSKAHAVYSASKGGILGLVMSLANELSTKEIRVNAIAPGTVETPMLEKVRTILGSEGTTKYLNQFPLGVGSPNSVVSLVEFLLDKEKSSWITGQNFVVDGGYTLN